METGRTRGTMGELAEVVFASMDDTGFPVGADYSLAVLTNPGSGWFGESGK
jgi:hypothetical protein